MYKNVFLDREHPSVELLARNERFLVRRKRYLMGFDGGLFGNSNGIPFDAKVDRLVSSFLLSLCTNLSVLYTLLHFDLLLHAISRKIET